MGDLSPVVTPITWRPFWRYFCLEGNTTDRSEEGTEESPHVCETVEAEDIRNVPLEGFDELCFAFRWVTGNDEFPSAGDP